MRRRERGFPEKPGFRQVFPDPPIRQGNLTSRSSYPKNKTRQGGVNREGELRLQAKEDSRSCSFT